MINKYTNKQRGLLAIIMAMVMVFAGAAFVAAEVDASTNIASVNGVEYPTLESALSNANGKEITLLADAEYNGGLDGRTTPISIDGKKHVLKFTSNGNQVGGEVNLKNMTITVENNSGFMFGGGQFGDADSKVSSVTFKAPAFVYGGQVEFESCVFEQDFQISSGDPVVKFDSCKLNTFVSNTYNKNSGYTVGTNIIVSDNTSIKTLAVIGELVIPKGQGVKADCISAFKWTDGNGVETTEPAGTVVNNGIIIAEIDESMSQKINGSGEIFEETPENNEMEAVTLSGVLESDINGKINQIITVTDDLIVKEGVKITVLGQFIVEEDATVEFQKGSSIEFLFGSKAIINGDISVGEGTVSNPTMVISNGADMDVIGSVTLDGANAFSNAGTVDIDGYFEISDVATANLNGSTIGADGELMVYGLVSGTITNNGVLTIDSEGILDENNDYISLTAPVVQMGADAEVVINNIYRNITISDSELEFKTGGEMKDVEYDNTITLSNIKGVTITEELVIKTNKEGARYGDNKMYLSGNMAVADDAKGTVNLTGTVEVPVGGTLNITDFVSMGKGVILSVPGTLLVSGEIDATSDNDNIKDISVSGTITVTGKITSDIAIDKIAPATINAAVYETASPEYYIYTTLEAALAAGATDITITGTVEIASDITVPVGTTVNATEADVKIKDGATVTVEAEDKKSAKFTNSSTDNLVVEGTLVIENLAKSGVNKNKIVSDTSKATEDDVGMTYTNVYNALANAVAGEEVEITAATVTLDKDLTVPAGVTLVIPVGNTIEAEENITITIDGTFAVEGTYNVIDASTVTGAEESDKDAATIVNGILTYENDNCLDIPDEYVIVGAYFGYDGVNVIAPLTVAAGMVDDVESDIILNGDMIVGDVAFDYTGDDAPELIANNKLTAGTIDLGALGFTASAESTVTATIALTNGSVILKDVKGVTVSDKPSYDADNNEIYTATITGTASANDGDANTTDDKGTVGIVGAVSSSMTTREGVTVNVPVDATMTLTTGTIDAIVVEGTVDVDGTATIKTATVMGTIDGNATVTITTLYAGVVKNDVVSTGASAVIGDKVALASAGVAYIAPGTTIGKGITEATGVKTTEYYVENGLYLTAYAGASSNAKIDDIVAKIDNAKFNGWLDADGEDVVAGALVGSADYDKVYASVDYEIFKVSVNTVPGTVVYIDGIKWAKDTEYTAGSHTIAVYLEAGYEGTPVINVNGTTVTDSFTISGEETVITVSGVTAATGSGTIVIEPAEDEGMALTDILLIVLVVLIVIMAIIVALRMMRS